MERMNAAVNDLREYANRTVETTSSHDGPYTTVRSIGEGASILRLDEEGTFSIKHNYLDPIGSLNADEAEQMAWELLAAAGELRKIEREHAAGKGE